MFGVGIVALALVAGCGGSSDDRATDASAPMQSGDAPDSPSTDDIDPTTTLAVASPATTGDESGPTDLSDQTDGSTDSGQSGEDSQPGTCTVTVTGDRTESWTFDQDITSFSSDYWLGEEQLRETVEFLGEEISGGSFEEIVASGRPVITFLSLSCSNPQDLVQGALVTHTNATRADDLPMAPGSYPISGGLFDAEGPAGTVIADFSVPDDELYGTVDNSGVLSISVWDRDLIEGSFAFDALEAFTDNPKEVHVEVTFTFVCQGFVNDC